MTFYDEKLAALQEKIARSRQLSAMLDELHIQRGDLAARVRELKTVKMEEQAEVDRLEGRSLAAFYYNVIGKIDERLSKERQEAYAARVKYDVAAKELEGVESDIRRYKEEFSALCGCEMEYAATLKEKTAAVKAAGGKHAEEILKLEERNAFLESQRKELREAISAGEAAKITAESVLESLDSAESWGTWDLLGGGLVANVAKHGHLDDAQSSVERLQSQLRRFKTELADVTIQADIHVNVDGFMRFADHFFDGLFVDWAVLDEISQSKSRMHETNSKIRSALSRLRSLVQAIEREQTEIKSKLDALVLEA